MDVGGYLYIYDNFGHYQIISPSCDMIRKEGKVCFTPGVNGDGDYVIFLVHGLSMKYFYEYIFQVYIEATGQLYTGNFMTMMKFIFKKVTMNDVISWEIVLSEESINIQPNTITW